MQQVVENIELSRLPSLPEILLRILREFGTENLQVRELAGLIVQDPALTFKILAVANSPAYRHQKTITSIEQCINLLGLKMVKTITVGASTQQFLNTLSGIVPVNFAQLWQHSQTTALLSEMVAGAVGYPHPQEAYVAGLLHDVGKLALLVTRTAAYTPLFRFPDSDDEISARETDLLGITHSEIGAMLVELWGLEPLIVDAIRYHHESFPRLASASELIKIVALANSLSKIGAKAKDHPSLTVARALFDMDAAKATALSSEAKAKVKEMAIALGIQVQEGSSAPESAETKRSAREDSAIGIQRQLAEEIHTSMTMDLAQDGFSAARSEEELLSGILQSATILFEPKQAFLFEWNAETNLVSGKPVLENQDSIGRIRFALSSDRSLVADALLSNRVTSSHAAIEYDDKFVVRGSSEIVKSMIDEQIIRMANAECMYCAPVATQNFMYGVLVLAFPLSVVERQDSRAIFLARFSRQAAAAIEKFRRDLASIDHSSVHDAAACQAYARQIVHEASNPLGILKNYLKLLDIKVREGQSPETEIKILNEEIDRVSRTIHKLVSSPAERLPSLGEVDVNATIREVVALCQPSLLAPLGIKLETRLDDQLPVIRSDANSLKQVLINLLKNAAEAMPDGGVLSIATASIVSQQTAGSVSITVSDNGPGIPQELLQNLFSPMASTKGEDNAGLGLSIVSGIVSELGGNISCKSSASAGTSFDITLPLGLRTRGRQLPPH